MLKIAGTESLTLIANKIDDNLAKNNDIESTKQLD